MSFLDKFRKKEDSKDNQDIDPKTAHFHVIFVPTDNKEDLIHMSGPHQVGFELNSAVKSAKPKVYDKEGTLHVYAINPGSKTAVHYRNSKGGLMKYNAPDTVNFKQKELAESLTGKGKLEDIEKHYKDKRDKELENPGMLGMMVNHYTFQLFYHQLHNYNMSLIDHHTMHMLVFYVALGCLQFFDK